MIFTDIDWEAPWFAALARTGLSLSENSDWLSEANRIAGAAGLLNHRELPVRFIPQALLPENTAYEAHISATGAVPTRDNLHDFFNALVWLHYPQTKQALNALHARSFDGANMSGTRGRQRDAATLFDENAALFISSDPIRIAGLREHRWRDVLHKSSEDFFSCCEVMLFGHALLEKLVRPYKSLTAHVWPVLVDADWWCREPSQRRADIDRRVSASISRGFTSADFCHLPVLGVPGWWPGQDAAFYEDSLVFRPMRTTKSLSAIRP